MHNTTVQGTLRDKAPRRAAPLTYDVGAKNGGI
jgi:hypothetical protein